MLSMVRASTGLCRPVVVLPADTGYEGRLTAALRGDGVDVLRGPVPVLRRGYLRPRALPRWGVDALRGVRWLRRTVMRLQPRAIVTNTSALAVGPPLARSLRTNHLWYVRELIESPAWYRRLVRWLARLPHGVVVANSKAVADWIGPLGERGPLVIHNAVPPSSGLQPLGDVPTAVFVGRLNEWKGWQDVIEAAGEVRQAVPGCRILLAGGTVPAAGITNADVRRAIAAVDPGGGFLQWVGELDDAREVMQRSWVVLVPSRRPEPFGNVVIEGMAEGRAVIGTRAGGITETVIEGETGLLVPPADPAALAAAMVRLLGDRGSAERMGRAGLERYELQFQPKRHAEAWRAQLERTLSPRP